MSPSSSRQPNHYVGEWYGQRIYPKVQIGEESLEAMQERVCPFLTHAFGETQKCIKPEPSQGVCTITTNDARRYGVKHGSIDWLVCPYRTLDDGLLEEVARRLFGIAVDAEPLIVAAVTLNKSTTHSRCAQRQQACVRLLPCSPRWGNLVEPDRSVAGVLVRHHDG